MKDEERSSEHTFCCRTKWSWTRALRLLLLEISRHSSVEPLHHLVFHNVASLAPHQWAYCWRREDERGGEVVATFTFDPLALSLPPFLINLKNSRQQSQNLHWTPLNKEKHFNTWQWGIFFCVQILEWQTTPFADESLEFSPLMCLRTC